MGFFIYMNSSSISITRKVFLVSVAFQTNNNIPTYSNFRTTLVFTQTNDNKNTYTTTRNRWPRSLTQPVRTETHAAKTTFVTHWRLRSPWILTITCLVLRKRRVRGVLSSAAETILSLRLSLASYIGNAVLWLKMHKDWCRLNYYITFTESVCGLKLKCVSEVYLKCA